MYETNWLACLAAFDTTFRNTHVRDRYLLLEELLQKDDPVVMSSPSLVLEFLTEATQDTQRFDTIIPKITLEGSVQRQYAPLIAEYNATREIAVRIKDVALPAYIARLWESVTSSSNTTQENILHAVLFYKDCQKAIGDGQPFSGFSSETDADMTQWHLQYQHAVLLQEKIDAVRQQYRTTFFSTKEELLAFVKETLIPLQKEATKGVKRIKQYYSFVEGISALSSDMREEIKNFAELQHQREDIQQKTAELNSSTTTLDHAVVGQLSLQQLSSLLSSCNQDYLSHYSLTPACPKFEALEEAYSVAYTTFTLRRDTWLSENRNDIGALVLRSAANNEIFYDDRLALKNITRIIQEIEFRTGISFGSEISHAVDDLDRKEKISPKKETHSSAATAHIPTSTTVQYSDYHPLWVSQQLEAFPQQDIPAHYRPLHDALVSEAKTAVVRAYTLLTDGTLFHALGYGHFSSGDEKRYLAAVHGLFRTSSYVQRALS
ncbi:hypothetical protein HZC31_03805 [Candidatus Woesearchaeota archaeon]|nr:hypothetical protein [Candidatus Woesearchaeota archaeon]